MANEDLLGELRIARHEREDHDDGSRRWLPWVVMAVILLMVLVGAWFWWSGARAIEVQTATASTPSAGDSGAVLQATGYVTARRQATVSAQIVGTLTEVLIEEGDHVEQGQVLARLEDSSQQAQLDAARASAAAARARVGEMRTTLAQAERDSHRLQDLVARDLVPRQQAEQAASQVDSLRAQLRSAEAQAETSAAQVNVARVNYDYTVVRAPFAGVITNKAAQVGEIIAPAAAGGGFTRTGVGTIVDMDSLEVDVDVNEAYIGRVKPHMPAEAVLDAYPDWTIPAHVIAIVPAADRSKATVKVRVGLDQQDERIVPDMGVRVSFMEKRAEPDAEVPSGVLVPASSIVERDGHHVVFVIVDGTARKRSISPDQQTFGDLRLLPSGVSAGEKVVVNPPAQLVDGDRIAVTGT